MHHHAVAQCLLLLLLLAFSPASMATEAAPAASSGDPAALLEAIAAAELDPSRAVAVRELRLQMGAAQLQLREGTVVPAIDPTGRVAEIVFIGQATLVVTPPDEIEADQLELFTGHPSLHETLTEGVFVVALDAAVEALLSRPAIAELDPATRERAAALYRTWRERPERSVLGIDLALWRDALGDPVYQGYFAGWLRGEELGEFLYVFEPDEAEPATLGQFTFLEATAREKRKLRRVLHREQRQGRLIGLDVESIGSWDTWFSAAGASGVSGRSFEPSRYVLDVRLDRDGGLVGRGRLELAAARAARIVRLGIDSDLTVTAARDAAGRELFVTANRGDVLVVLAEPVAAGEAVTLDVEWSGAAVLRDHATYALRSTERWYPHAGSRDLATYEVTYRWPPRLELMTGGRLVADGEEGDLRWETRAYEHPSWCVSFEMGNFDVLTTRAGDVEIVLALDPTARELLGRAQRQEVLDALADALGFLAESFGPYPLDRLAVVTVPRLFSQSFHGFVTLSTLSLAENDHWLSLLLGIEDRRTLIAHELAHQWWGHQVSWTGYRDQWLSEAMANYAAVLYARTRLRGEGVDAVRLGPTSGWEAALLATTTDGRPLESIGPLVLGERLASSRADAYDAVVYKKGALVVDMLSRRFGEAMFLEMLRRLVAATSFRAISTETFFAALAKLSGVELDGFVDTFVHDTGLPEVYYRYDFAPAPAADGTWEVSGTIRREAPFRYRFGLRRRPDGGLDVTRERVLLAEAADVELAVPLRVAAYDSARDDGKRRRGEPDPREIGNVTVEGRLLLTDLEVPFAFPVPHEPKELWLDRDSEIFARFFNERRYPKRMLYYRAIDAAAAGQSDEALGLLEEAVAAPVFAGPSYTTGRTQRQTEKELDTEARLLDVQIHLLATRLHLDHDRLPAAQAAHAAAEARVDAEIRGDVEDVLRVSEARLALHAGDPARTYRLLHRAVVKRGDIDRVEADLLLAIAAKATGRMEDAAEAVERAKEKGAEVGLLAAG